MRVILSFLLVLVFLVSDTNASMCGGSYTIHVYSVQSDNGGSSGGNNGDNNGISDPHAGYVHKVGIHKVYVSTKKKKRYRGGIVVDINNIPKMYFRAKLKRKGAWEDVCVDFHISTDKYYANSQDPRIETKCKDLAKRKYRKKKKKSVYSDSVNMSEYITEPGTYYVYIDVYDGDHNEKFNRSTEGDRKERALIIVTGLLPEPVITESDGSSPIYQIEEGGYFTKYTLNPVNLDTNNIIGYAFAEPQEGTVPVHEFESDKQYFYVATDWERDNVLEGKDWDYLGIAFHAYPAGSTEGEPFWRSWHYDSKTHDWTADLSLRNYWETSGSHRSEGNAWQILNPVY